MSQPTETPTRATCERANVRRHLACATFLLVGTNLPFMGAVRRRQRANAPKAVADHRIRHRHKQDVPNSQASKGAYSCRAS